jgi:hypothetical protein
LYVAGEILVWMLLALGLGILLGWFVWGLRSREADQRTALEHEQQIAALRGEADEMRRRNQELQAIHARDAATITNLQRSAGGDTAPLVARVAELESAERQVDLLRQRVFELERSVPQAEVDALRAQAEESRVELEALRARFSELGAAFGGELDLSDPATVRLRWSAMQARAAESDHLARQLDGLRAVLGGELDPAALQERFSDLEERAGEADALRARLAGLEGDDG